MTDGFRITMGSEHLNVERDDAHCFDDSYSALIINISGDQGVSPQPLDVGPVQVSVTAAKVSAQMSIRMQDAVLLRDHLTHLIDTAPVQS